jgi:hypothetical protein
MMSKSTRWERIGDAFSSKAPDPTPSILRTLESVLAQISDLYFLQMTARDIYHFQSAFDMFYPTKIASANCIVLATLRFAKC